MADLDCEVGGANCAETPKAPRIETPKTCIAICRGVSQPGVLASWGHGLLAPLNLPVVLAERWQWPARDFLWLHLTYDVDAHGLQNRYTGMQNFQATSSCDIPLHVIPSLHSRTIASYFLFSVRSLTFISGPHFSPFGLLCTCAHITVLTFVFYPHLHRPIPWRMGHC